MSHITLLQYITQLQNLGLTQPQINASVQEWKKIHEPKKVEKPAEVVEQVNVTDEVKTPAVAEKGTTVTAETKEVSDSDSSSGTSVSTSIDGLYKPLKLKTTSELLFGKEIDGLVFDWQEQPGPVNFFGSLGELDKNLDLQKEKLLEFYGSKTTLPGETVKGQGNFEYKYEIDPDTNKRIFYYKGPNDKDWINQTKRLDENPKSDIMANQMIGVLSELGFVSKEAGKEAYDIQQQNKEIRRKNKEIEELNKIREDYLKFSNKINDYWSNQPKRTFDDKLKALKRAESQVRGMYDTEGVNRMREQMSLLYNDNRYQYSPGFYTDYYYSKGDKRKKFYKGLHGTSAQGYIADSYGLLDKNSALGNALGADLTKKFIGYLNRQGLSEDFAKRVMKGDFGFLGVHLGRHNELFDKLKEIYGYKAGVESSFGGGGDIESPESLAKLEIARQRTLATYLTNFLQENSKIEKNKILDGYISLNPDKFKGEKGNLYTAANRKIAEKLISKLDWNKDNLTNFDFTDYEKVQNYVDNFFPELKEANENTINARNKRLAEIQEKGGWDGTLKETGDAIEQTVLSRANNFGSLIIEDVFKGDLGASQTLQAEEQVQSVGNLKKTVIKGKTAVINGKKYLLEDDIVYDVETSTPIITQDAIVSIDDPRKIKDVLAESDTIERFVSGSAALSNTTAALVGLAVDVYGTRGVGRAAKLLKRVGIKNIIKIPQARLNGMVYWSGLGYVQGKYNTYNELVANGVSTQQAAELSETAAVQTSLLYGAAGIFSPTEKYFSRFTRGFNLNNNIKEAVKNLTKKGNTESFASLLRKSLPKRSTLVETSFNVIQENIEENLQESVTQEIINKRINQELGREVLDEEYTDSEIAETTLISSGVSIAASNIKLPSSTSNYDQLLNSLYLMSKNSKETQKALRNLVKNGEITQEQSSKLLNQVKALVNQSPNIPNYVSAKGVLESSMLLQEIQDLKARKKQQNEAFHPRIDELIKSKQKQLAEIVKPEIEKSLSRQGAKAKAEQLGASFETFSNQESIDARKAEIESQGGKTVKSVGYGEAITTADGQTIILINDQVAGEDNKYTTDQHEVLHPFWEQALKGNPELAISFGKALMNEFLTNTEITGGAKFLQRFQQYVNDPNYSAEATWSEVIPLMSEALSEGDIAYNKKQDSWWKSLGKKISNFLGSGKKPLNITFDTGKDVFDFILAYNESTEAGKGFTDSQLKVAQEGAEGQLVEQGFTGDIDTEAGIAIEDTANVLTEQDAARAEQEIKENVAVESKRVEDSQEVQRLYDQQGEAAAFDIIQKFKPITNKIVESRSQAPNFDRQLLTDEIETGERGILDLIRSYNPDSGVPLAAYINKFLPSRAIEASQRVLGEEFTEDVTEARGVITEEITETVETAPKTRLTKPSSLLPAEAVTEITEQVKEKIKGIDPKNMTFKKLGDLAPEIIAREIGIPVKKLTDPRANLSKADATAIQQFVTKNADKLLRILPEGSVTEAASDDILGTSTGVPTGLLKAFYTKGKRGTRGAGLTPFIKNKNISKADFLEAFGIVEGKKAEGFSARSPQAQALKGIASLYGRLVTNEVARSPEVDLKPEVKQRVAAGKSKAMASRRFATESAIEADSELNNLFIEAAQAKDINAIASSLGLPKITVNDSNREAKQKEMLKFIKQGKIPSVIFTAAKFGNFGRKKVKGKYIDIPARGGLYFGSKDPAYQEALKAARENDALYPNLKRPKRVNIKKAFTEDGDIQAEANMDFLNEFTNVLNDAVNKDGMPIEMAALFITSSYQATTGAIKIAAGFKYKSSKFEYAGPDGKASDNKGVKYREEHTIPASVVGANLILAINNNAVKPTMDAVRKNFYQIQLSKKDDTKLDKANLGSTLPQGQSIFNNPIGRLAAAGINLQTIVNPETGETIAEENGVAINKELYNAFGANSKLQAAYIQNEQIVAGFTNPDLNVKAMIDALVPLAPSKVMASKRDSEMEPSSLSFNKFEPVQDVVNNLGKADEALSKAKRVNPPVKKIRVFDFDDTLARSKSKIIVIKPMSQIDGDMLDIVARRKFKKEFENLPSRLQSFGSLNGDQQLEVLKETPGATTEINATQFAEQAADLEAQGATFDFSQFEQVIEGKKGPLFKVAKKIADTRGTEDLFVLTARPQEAAGPIKQFMQSLGINIPLNNITGLGNGTPQAKARWMVDKAAEGYNDFYFADDATKNVKAVKDVLDQLDVKSRVQQARASKRDTFNTIVNDMIESSSGIESYKTFSAAKARTVGKNKGRFDWLTLASSAEDFKGLLYRLLGNGKKGEAQYEFLKTNLIDVYNRAEDSIVQAKIAAANDFMALKSQFPGIPKTLETETGVGKFNYQHALRVYMWTRQGMSIPGLSKADARKLNKFITDDVKLQAFADQLISIQKGKPYPEPGKDWLAGNLTTDIIGGINKVNRAEYQQEFRENVDIIFSPENLNKMEAAYGTRWRKSLENTLKRMKAGTNRLGYNDQTSAVLDWVNNSVGAVMFLNTRSALLQTISAVNFINWGDNNIIKAGQAFANQKQFWADFMTLMNSDYLVQRRNGLKINVSESEIADAVKDSKNKVNAAISYLLSKGFVLTRYADSFAIASGGATFYRNRIKKYLKEGMDQKLAEEKAFEDFRQISEESQQSSSPDKISMQQASAAGRVILNWANTPMQYVRIQKRALQDLIAGRGDAKVHMSRIAYYGVMQNLIFNAMQQALFAIAFGDDEEDEEKSAAKKKQDEKKIARVANGMIDSQLKGLGIAGSAMVAVKNTLMKIYEESGKQRPEYEKGAIEALSFSPAISSKYRKIVGGLKSFSWNMKEIKQKGFSLDNPAYLAGAQIITAVTNIPIDRVVKKANNIRGMLSEQSQMWQKVILFGGWSTWDVGLPYYGGWDKPVEPTPAEIKKQEFDKLKKDTKTADQVQMLLDLGLNKKQIKALRYEDARVKKIIELQNKKKKDE